MLVAVTVILTSSIVDVSIKLNNKAGPIAVEVNHEPVYDLLATKLRTCNLSPSEILPQKVLWNSLACTQIPR